MDQQQQHQQAMNMMNTQPPQMQYAQSAQQYHHHQQQQPQSSMTAVVAAEGSAAAHQTAAAAGQASGGASSYVPGTSALAQQQQQLNYQHLQQHHQQQLQMFWQGQMSEIEQVSDFKNHQLPLARIKKIMKADEDVRMISAEAPVLFAKACEMFILELTLRSWIHTEENKRRTLQKNDIAAAITRTDIFDFLVDIVPRDELNKEDGLGIPRGIMPIGSPVSYEGVYYMPQAAGSLQGAGGPVTVQQQQRSYIPQQQPMQQMWQQQQQQQLPPHMGHSQSGMPPN
ncbi:unnamed protein product [Sphagnum balticum]